MDLDDETKMIEVIRSCIGTKFLGQYGDLACKIALQAVKTITVESGGSVEVDIKKWARIEKVCWTRIRNRFVAVFEVHV